MTPITLYRGAQLSLAIDVVSGDPSVVTSATATMKRTESGQLTGAAIALSCIFAAASGADPARWLVTLADTSALEVGAYQIDARLVAGVPIITDPVWVRVVPAASS